MQQSITKPQNPEVVHLHELREITELLVKHHGIHDGLYNLAVEFQVTVGGVGRVTDPSLIIPGASFGINRLGLSIADTAGVTTVNAAEVNPRFIAKMPAAKKAAVKKPAVKKAAVKKPAAKKV